MSYSSPHLVAAAGVAVSAVAFGCDPVNFDSLATGTAVTTQFPGVTFSATSQTCPNPTQCVVAVPRSGASSSGLRCLTLATGCPDFSPEGIRMVFARPQSEIHLNIGTYSDSASVTVRGYSATGTLVFSGTYAFPSAGSVSRSLRVVPSGSPIVRLEVQSSGDDFEYIDDLDYDLDSTPPIAVIASHGDFSCFCPGSTFLGTASDAESDVSWTLRVRPVNSATFTTVATGTNQVGAGALGSWAASPAASFPEGYYVVQLAVTNRCDLTSTADRLIYVNRAASIADIRIPLSGDVVGGSVCFDGTVTDLCPSSPFYYVEYAPVGGTVFTAVDPAHISYTQQINSDPFATWNTRGTVADGAYRIRVRTADSCSNTATVIRDVIVDNTSPTSLIATPYACSNVAGIVPVTGTASDANLSGWALDFTGGDQAGWVAIATGTSAMNGGVLGLWNTTGLRPCAYTIRLTVTDRARLGCAGGPNVSVYTRSVDVGCPSDFNDDGTVDFFDYLDFVDAFSSGC